MEDSDSDACEEQYKRGFDELITLNLFLHTKTLSTGVTTNTKPINHGSRSTTFRYPCTEQVADHSSSVCNYQRKTAMEPLASIQDSLKADDKLVTQLLESLQRGPYMTEQDLIELSNSVSNQTKEISENLCAKGVSIPKLAAEAEELLYDIALVDDRNHRIHLLVGAQRLLTDFFNPEQEFPVVETLIEKIDDILRLDVAAFESAVPHDGATEKIVSQQQWLRWLGVLQEYLRVHQRFLKTFGVAIEELRTKQQVVNTQLDQLGYKG